MKEAPVSKSVSIRVNPWLKTVFVQFHLRKLGLWEFGLNHHRLGFGRPETHKSLKIRHLAPFGTPLAPDKPNLAPVRSHLAPSGTALALTGLTLVPAGTPLAPIKTDPAPVGTSFAPVQFNLVSAGRCLATLERISPLSNGISPRLERPSPSSNRRRVLPQHHSSASERGSEFPDEGLVATERFSVQFKLQEDCFYGSATPSTNCRTTGSCDAKNSCGVAFA